EKANKVKSSKLRRLRKVGASKRVESSDDMENVFNQGRMIDDLDKDEGIELVKDADITETEGRHAAELAEKQAEIYHLDLDHSSQVLNVVTAASQVSAANATISAAKPSILVAAPTVVAAYTRRRKGDKCKAILIETPKPMKKKDQIKLDAEYARKLHKEINKDHEEINKDIDWDAAMVHVKKIQESSNTAGYKMDFFKGMSYTEICLIFQARFDENIRELNEEAQKAKDLKKHLKVVDDEDDDVFIEATPLARKVPVVDYEIVLISNKPRFKIIKADETHQLYISFITLLKNFDREDLENLRGIVKERFSTSKPTNFSDEYLLLTLKTMFEKPDRQDAGRQADTQAEIYNIDLDHSSKVLSMKEDDAEVQEAVEIVTTAKLMTEVVTAATTQVVAASTPIPAAKPTVVDVSTLISAAKPVAKPK
nr:hypothetical protein [Tanacetum cinerariifolium]